PAVRLGAGQHVVPVRGVAAPVDHLALFVEGGLLGELVVGAVEVVHVLRDDGALGVLPRAAPDPIARVDARRAARTLRAEVRAPRVSGGPHRLRERLADLVRTLEAAQVRTLPGTRAGDEEGHAGGLSVRAGRDGKTREADVAGEGHLPGIG